MYGWKRRFSPRRKPAQRSRGQGHSRIWRGPSFVGSLIENDLIDQFAFLRNPVASPRNAGFQGPEGPETDRLDGLSMQHRVSSYEPARLQQMTPFFAFLHHLAAFTLVAALRSNSSDPGRAHPSELPGSCRLVDMVFWHVVGRGPGRRPARVSISRRARPNTSTAHLSSPSCPLRDRGTALDLSHARVCVLG